MFTMRSALLLALLGLVAAVDRSKFRTCSDASFCRRHRSKAAEPEFKLLADTLRVGSDGALTASLQSAVPGSPLFELKTIAYTSGVARLRITEKTDMAPRWESPDIIQEGELTHTTLNVHKGTDAVVQRLAGASASSRAGVSWASYSAKDGKTHLLSFTHSPFQANLYVEGFGSTSPAVTVNDRGLLYFEHRRTKGESQVAADTAAAAAAAAGGRKILDWGEDGKPIYEDGSHGDDGSEAAQGAGEAGEGAGGRDVLASASGGDAASGETGLWEESFHTHHDSKPFGPTSVGVDITFPAATFVYGIPEHASSHALHATDGSEPAVSGPLGPGGDAYDQPYRLYNLDVFEYELDNPMALYGSIPFMLAHGPSGATVGVFWNNPTETYVDVKKGLRTAGQGVGTRWISESGIFDLSLIPGPAPKAAITQFTSMVGTQGLPPLFALGYHQCRWNYKDEADVYAVDAKFEEHAFPYDVIWLDIEHTDGKRYFTWDSHLFPHPADMQNKLAARGHKTVTIIDPHMKRDPSYRIHSEAQSRGLYIRNKDGGEYDGWCWPGSSSYLDFTTDRTREWWADQFALDKYPGSTQHLYTWNDMNEPSVFNGPEVSMHKDAKSLGGVEHREWHNLYGFYQIMATHEGQLRRAGPDRNTRTFILSRAFYAGTQRYGAIWTGDNAAKWEHLAMAAPMLLTTGVAGLTFSGADVGGFFNNPSTELMIRWYQAGAFQPFFRAHAHLDTARREPWLFGDEVLSTLRDIVRTRYTYLPLWYTLFHTANATGVPTMRPLWLEYPHETAVFGIDDQWLVGADLLVKPVTAPGTTTLPVYFPGAQPWYDAVTYAKTQPGGVRTVAAPLGTIPVYQRGGAIVPRQMRPRRASSLMAADPYTLIVTLDNSKRASGTLYLDDGTSYDFARKGAYRLRQFDYAPSATAPTSIHTLRSTAAGGGKSYAPSNTVERIVIAGIGGAPPRSVTAVDSGASDAAGAARTVSFEYDAAADVLVLRKPDVRIAYDWSITLQW